MATAGFWEDPCGQDAFNNATLKGQIEPLRGDNYRVWAARMRMILRQKGLAPFISDPVPTIQPAWDVEQQAKFLARQDAALATIYLGVSTTHCSILDGVDTPKAAWEKLQQTYEPTTRAHIAALKREYMNTRFDPGTGMSIFIAKVESCVRRLEAAGEKITDSDVSYHLIANLPPDYEGLVNTIYMWEDSNFTPEKVKSALCAQFGRLQEKEKQESQTGSAFRVIAVTNREPASTSRINVVCFRCNRRGHYARDCLVPAIPTGTSVVQRGRTNSRGRSRGRGRRTDRVTATSTQVPSASTDTTPKTFHCGFYVAAYVGSAIEEKDAMDKLAVTFDSAATHHIVKDRKFFKVYREIENGKVKFGNNVMIAKGIGQVEIKMGTHTMILKNVLFVPDLDRNLMSGRDLDRTNHEAILGHGTIELISPTGALISRAKVVDEFYIFEAVGKTFPAQVERKAMAEVNAVPNVTNLSRVKSSQQKKIVTSSKETVSKESDLNKDTSMLWHDRLGHASVRTIKEMKNKKSIRGLDDMVGQEKICLACKEAKSTRGAHPPIGNVTTRRLLELVHSDVWGPAPVSSFGGSLYFVTFIDDFSREVVVYTMVNKSEVFDRFDRYRRLAERQTGERLQRLRTDNGMEYCSRRMTQELQTLGIHHERTNNYSPAMNGIAERYNRTVVEAVRALLIDARLPAAAWGELLITSVYLRNRVKHRITHQLPVALWTGRVPSCRHLRRIGCVAYMHLKPPYRNKLESRTRQGVLLGYAQRTKGYRIWLPDTNEICETMHVTFDENTRGFQQLEQLKEEKLDPYWVDTRPCLFDAAAPQPNDLETEDDGEKEIEFEEDDDNTQALNDSGAPGLSTFLKKKESTSKLKHTKSAGGNLPPGWTKLVTQRKKGNRRDVYFYTDDKRRLRSPKEVEEYCAKRGIQYIASNFDWSASMAETNTGQYYEDTLSEGATAYYTNVIIPNTYKQAQESTQCREWNEAIKTELQTMEDRNVWTEESLPENTRALGTKWVFNTKADDEGYIKRFRARLVALGNHQKEGLDYTDTYSPVINFELVRFFVMLLVTLWGWSHAQVDITCAYLYGTLHEQVYIKLPKGYEPKSSSTTHLRLKRALYGLHQSGRCWSTELDDQLKANGFKAFASTNCVYTLGNRTLLLVYVDDIAIFSATDEELEETIQKLEAIFDLKRLGKLSTFLGVKFDIEGNKVTLHQTQYIRVSTDKFGIATISKPRTPIQAGGVPTKNDCPATQEEKQQMSNKPYRQLLGCVMFLSQRTRPDIALACSILGQYASQPGIKHWNALQQLMQYCYHTQELAIQYLPGETEQGVTVYVDSDWASCVDDRKSITGYVIYYSNQIISWRSCKQKCVALSSMESEFIAMSEAIKELVWLMRIIKECEPLGIIVKKPIVYCDSISAMEYTKSSVENVRTKHVDIRYRFVKDLYDQGLFELRYVPSKLNTADMFTKALPKIKFEGLRNDLIQ